MKIIVSTQRYDFNVAVAELKFSCKNNMILIL